MAIFPENYILLNEGVNEVVRPIDHIAIVFDEVQRKLARMPNGSAEMMSLANIAHDLADMNAQQCGREQYISQQNEAYLLQMGMRLNTYLSHVDAISKGSMSQDDSAFKNNQEQLILLLNHRLLGFIDPLALSTAGYSIAGVVSVALTLASLAGIVAFMMFNPLASAFMTLFLFSFLSGVYLLNTASPDSTEISVILMLGSLFNLVEAMIAIPATVFGFLGAVLVGGLGMYVGLEATSMSYQNIEIAQQATTLRLGISAFMTLNLFSPSDDVPESNRKSMLYQSDNVPHK